MAKAPGSGSGPSLFADAGPPDYARPGAALVVVAITLGAAVVVLASWGAVRSALDALPAAIAGVVTVAALLVAGAVLAARCGGPRIGHALGLRMTPLDLALGASVALIARAATELVVPTTGRLVPAFGGADVAMTVALAVVGSVLIAPIAEELFFRGALQRAVHRLAAARFGRVAAGVVAVAVSSSAFAALHVAASGAATTASLLGPVLVGIGAGTLVAVTGRLGSAVILHVLYNLGGVLLMLR